MDGKKIISSFRWTMTRLLLASLSLSMYFAAYAQRVAFIITGKVVDQATQEPLAGASVFCQNTTIGVISNAEGQFTLRLPSGGYDLVVSYTGYETVSQRINDENAASPLSIELKAQDKSLQEVAVVGSNEVADGWMKYGKFFFENFIGTTPNAANCTIQNPDSLRFYFSKKRNRLKILSRSDLIVTNAGLGYKIRYQLDSFVHEYNDGVSTFSGYPLFEEMEGTDSQKMVWNVNRAKAYSGSRMHFMRSWYDSSLTRKGFLIERIADSNSTIGNSIENPFDSSFYRADSSDVQIDLKGRFRVVYRSELPDPQYLAAFKFSPHARVQISLIDIADTFIIERNGYFYEQADLINSGYWSWEKLADALPYNYAYSP